MQATLRVLPVGLLIHGLAAPAAAAGAATTAVQPPVAAAAVAPPARLVVQSPATIEFEILIQPTAQTEELRVVAPTPARSIAAPPSGWTGRSPSGSIRSSGTGFRPASTTWWAS